MALEEEFDVDVDEEELEGIETVGPGLRPGHRASSDEHRGARVAVTGVGVVSRRAASAPRPSGQGLLGARTRGRAPDHRLRPRARTSTTPRRPVAPTASPSSPWPRPHEALDAGRRRSPPTRGRSRRDHRHRRRRPRTPSRSRSSTFHEKGAPPGVAVPRPDDDVQRRRRGRSRCATAGRARARPRSPPARPAPTRSATPPGSSPTVAATPSSPAAAEAAMTPVGIAGLHQHDGPVDAAACPGRSTPTATAS